MDTFAQRLQNPTGLTVVILIVIYFLLALLISVLARRLTRWLLGFRWFLPRRRHISPDRHQTLEGLIGSLISLLAFVGAFIGILSLFVEADTLIWIVGLFSAAFGLGARSLVADVLAGGRFIFRNTFAIGEKVELIVAGTAVEGTVEEVNVTNTLVRAAAGELYVVPNGDITVIRNFSRAPHSTARLRLCVPSAQVAQAKEMLEGLGQEAAMLLPELTEPWTVISTSEVMSNKTELTVMAHTPYGRAASLKLEMIDLIYRRLGEANIELAD